MLPNRILLNFFLCTKDNNKPFQDLTRPKAAYGFSLRYILLLLTKSYTQADSKTLFQLSLKCWERKILNITFAISPVKTVQHCQSPYASIQMGRRKTNKQTSTNKSSTQIRHLTGKTEVSSEARHQMCHRGRETITSHKTTALHCLKLTGYTLCIHNFLFIMLMKLWIS